MHVVDGTLLDLAETLSPPFSDLLWRMERRGVYISFPELARISAEAEADRAKAAAALDAFAGATLNWNANTTDVATFLYDTLGLPEMPDDARSPKQWGKTRITANEALEWFWRHYPERRPEIDTLRAYRRACRAKNYARDLAERARPTEWVDVGRVHPCFGTYSDTSSNQSRDKTGTATGRLSISNPPLQQIPRDKTKDPYRVRRVFVAPPRQRFVCVDLSQLEVRIQAHLHAKLFGDYTLRDKCLAGDFHGAIAYRVFSKIWPTFADWSSFGPSDIKNHPDPKVRWCRDQVKAVFFGLAYGKGVKAFGNTLWTIEGEPVGEDAAQAMLDGVFDELPAIPRYQDWVRDTVREKGGMWSLLGRWRPLTRDKRGYRQGLNHPMQGSGSEIAQLWMLGCRGLDLRCMVHDELHLICNDSDGDKTVKQVVEAAREVGEALSLACPLDADGGHGPSWEESKG